MKFFIAIVIVTLLTITQTSTAKDKEVKVSVEQVKAMVNINSATAEELASHLTGIGMKKAQLIIEYRTQFGEFKSANELTAVKGIGEKTVQKNRTKIGL